MKSLFHLVCPQVSVGVPVLVQPVIHGLGVIHLVNVAHGLDGEQDNLLIGIAVFGL